jgi:hypothetical protein
MSRRQLFELGRQKCDILLAKYPQITALLSVSRQIKYLIGIDDGSVSDRSRLREISIGLITSREIEQLDDKAAETFYQIASESKRM